MSLTEMLDLPTTFVRQVLAADTAEQQAIETLRKRNAQKK
jgi:hypothetical protein